MNAAKWLKWKIGAITAVLLVLILQFIKSSPQFQLMVDKEAASKSAPGSADFRSNDEDDIMREWQQQQDTPYGDDRFSRSDVQGRRHFSSQGGSGFDTRTSRS